MRKTTKRILSGVMAAASLASFAACGDSSSGGSDGNSTGVTTQETTENVTTTEKTEWTGDNVEVTVAEDSSLDTTLDTQGKVLKWMGFYDLNPTNDQPERLPEVALFEDTYGATIQYIETTVTTQFDDLATAILGGTPPDIFIHSDRAFPYDINQGRFQPIDSLVDWSDPMWAEVKETADRFLWNGEHYIAPLGYSFNDYQLLMYNKTRVEDEGLDDPFELYQEGKWDWDAFTGIMKDYVSNGSDRYGICGWWANAFVYTAGDTLVTYDGNKFTNNLYSSKIERAQSVLEDIWANALVKRGWYQDDVFDNGGETLFYGMGTWAYEGVTEAYPNDVIQIVPFPKDPEQTEDYIGKRLLAYMWVKGSDNADCVKAWFDVNRLVNYDPQYIQTTKDKFIKNSPGWTSEMYDLVLGFGDDDKFNFAYEYGSGISTLMTGDDGVIRTLYEGIANEHFESWVQGREMFMTIVDQELAEYN